MSKPFMTDQEFKDMVRQLREHRTNLSAKAQKGGVRGWWAGHQKKHIGDAIHSYESQRGKLVKSAEHVYAVYAQAAEKLAVRPELSASPAELKRDPDILRKKRARGLRKRREAALSKTRESLAEIGAARGASGTKPSSAVEQLRRTHLQAKTNLIDKSMHPDQAPGVPEQYRAQAREGQAKAHRALYRSTRKTLTEAVEAPKPATPATPAVPKVIADAKAREAKTQADWIAKKKREYSGGSPSANPATPPEAPSIAKPDAPAPKPEVSGGTTTPDPGSTPKAKAPPKPKPGFFAGMKPVTRSRLTIGAGVATGLAGLAAVRSATKPTPPAPPKMAGLAALIWK